MKDEKILTQRRKDTKKRKIIFPLRLRVFASKVLSFIVILFFVRTLTLPIHLYAQEDGSIAVTFDDVNAIAKKLYCPVCPNETLDACQTEACAQWRSEIADQLSEGQNEQQIIDSFVRRYGDRVVAIPQDEGLRVLSLVTPYVLAGLALVVGGYTFLRWRRPASLTALPASPSTPIEDDYRARLERDLRE